MMMFLAKHKESHMHVPILRIGHFVRVIIAINVKGMRFELNDAANMHYDTKYSYSILDRLC
ncbi:phototropic-responsive NPH3 family protein, putative [Medicago truncatula]|uniref:Phototropic-responsive NPH3 family protein, putative n=1 Tax=Medicago truncatula TaxID=3880 RepID=G7IL86_MEDTR|nr:phototropic-responsive NPH3 family protein, putative [Medicago truncatula]